MQTISQTSFFAVVRTRTDVFVTKSREPALEELSRQFLLSDVRMIVRSIKNATMYELECRDGAGRLVFSVDPHQTVQCAPWYNPGLANDHTLTLKNVGLTDPTQEHGGVILSGDPDFVKTRRADLTITIGSHVLHYRDGRYTHLASGSPRSKL
jgi:hypothetical protein